MPWSLEVTRATAMPGRPPKPRPGPDPPRDDGTAGPAPPGPVASSSAKVMPSAPVPPPILTRNEARRPELGTGTEYTAEPAWFLTGRVRLSVVPAILALPLNIQPPPGGGTAIPLGAA